MFSRNATNAFVSKMRGLRDGIRQPKTRFVREMEDAPDTHDLIERREPLRERQDGKVDERADGRVVVQRHERVHLQAVQENLNHDQPGGLELSAVSAIVSSAKYALETRNLQQQQKPGQGSREG